MNEVKTVYEWWERNSSLLLPSIHDRTIRSIEIMKRVEDSGDIKKHSLNTQCDWYPIRLNTRYITNGFVAMRITRQYTVFIKKEELDCVVKAASLLDSHFEKVMNYLKIICGRDRGEVVEYIYNLNVAWKEHHRYKSVLWVPYA